MNKYTFLIIMFGLFGKLTAQVPSTWTVNPAAYSNTVTVTCKINYQCADLANANNVIAAFVNGQCRGVANTNIYASTTGDQMATLVVYSNSAFGEKVTFQSYIDASNTIFLGIDTVTYKADSIYGNLITPFIVTENHNPTDILISSPIMAENLAIGDTVDLLDALDDDTPNIFTFTLPSGQFDNDDYIINGNALTLNKLLDYVNDPRDTVLIEVADASGCTYQKVIALTITDLTYAPEANRDNILTDEDTPVVFDLLANDFDGDGDLNPNSITLLLTSSIGNSTISNGVLTYTPNPGTSGTDTLIYEVCDLTSPTPLCDTALVVVTIAQIDDNPIAIVDNYITVEDSTILMSILINDYDQDNNMDTASLTVIQVPNNGSFTILTNGVISYSPTPYFFGTDTLIYEICDLTAPTPLCDTALVVINVITVPDPPVASNDTLTADEDVTTIFNVLNNDTDPDNDIDPSSVVIYSGPFNGSVTVDAIGNISYLGNANYNGLDSLYYSVCDLTSPIAFCDTALVLITVTSVDDSPFANIDNYLTVEDSTITMDVLSNDLDYDNNIDTASLTIIQAPNNGSYLILPNGEISYTPAPYFYGYDTLVYEICDLTSPTPLCDTALVIINVVTVPNSPVAINDTLTIDEDISGMINVLSNDTDPDNDIDSSSVMIYSGPFNGSATVDAFGNITYLGNADYNGLDSLYYVVCDLSLTGALCDTAMVLINVQPIADAPQAINDLVTTDEDQMISIDVLINDVDPENDINPASLTIIAAPQNGLANVNAGQIDYTPNSYFYGLDSLMYEICDLTSPVSLCDTAVVYIQVLEVPNAPYEIIIDTLFLYENNELHHPISSIHTLDHDPIDHFSYALVSGTGDEDNDQFAIIDSTLFIETKANYDIKTIYHIRVQTTDSYGLTYEQEFVVEILDLDNVDIPLPSTNFISPNGDGKNDYWEVENVEIYQDLQLMIFDQFGQILYQVDSGYDNTWDAYYNGKPLPSGNYYYIFKNATVTYKGNITIVNY
ncbi:MAG: tandem-95 repeat protein [Flavobacteriales bacterium]|nr:tandem-95 repeat protein [Flavobacteriales bacterium]